MSERVEQVLLDPILEGLEFTIDLRRAFGRQGDSCGVRMRPQEFDTEDVGGVGDVQPEALLHLSLVDAIGLGGWPLEEER